MHAYVTIRPRRPLAIVLSGASAWILLLSAAAGVAQAGEIYKSVDSQGNLVYTDHRDPSMSQTTIVQVDEPPLPPRELHFCWTNCFTLILEKGVYRRADGTDENWTVETFSAEAVVLHRHDAPADWNRDSRDVVYAGQVSNGRLIGVTVDGNPMSGVDASWGAALNTLPGSNAERDAGNGANADSSSAGTVSSAAPPPPLPAEEQPALPEDGDLWTPGYWSWRDHGYSWISGAWARPPRSGMWWTPAFWGFAGTVFIFHPGYWGPTVGFYGGVNYGYGYFGNGYSGGRWTGGSFSYNTAINHLDPAVVHHSYAESVPNQGSRGVVSYMVGARDNVDIRTPSRRPSLRQPVNKPATTTIVQRSIEHEPKAVEVDRPADVVKMPRASASAKISHAPTRGATAPVKQ